MSRGTLATADYPPLQEMVDNTPAGCDDRDDWVVEGRTGCLVIAGGDHQIGRINEAASAAAGISAIPTEEEHA